MTGARLACDEPGCTDAATTGPDGTWCFVRENPSLWGKVDIRSRDECWKWTASLDAYGYGQYHIPGRRGTWPVKAHRVAYEQLHGPIPDGLEIDHLCRNRACVNPRHLEAVTHAENVRRGARARDTCYYGHPLDGFKPSRGTRYCKTCNREGEKARRDARKVPPEVGAGPQGVCWEYQAAELPIRLPFTIKVF